MRNKLFAMNKEQLIMRNEQKRSLSSLSLSKGSKGLIKNILALTAFIFCLLFAGCDNGLGFKDSDVPSGYGRVSVNVSMGSAHSGALTIFPNAADNHFTRYIYTFTPTAGDPIVEERPATDEGTDSFILPLGTYTVGVKAYDSDDNDDPAATGTSASFNVVTVGAGKINITLTPVTASGKGILEVNLTSPAGSELSINLVDIDGKSPFEGLQEPPDGIVMTDNSISGVVEIDAGSYLLILTVTRGADKTGKVEVVHIYRSLTTKCNIAFTEDDLNVPNYRMTLTPNETINFSTAKYLDPVPTAKTLTIHNNGKLETGTLVISLSGGTGGYKLSKELATSIQPSGSDTFTIQPDAGLNVGSYTRKVTVEGTKSKQELEVNFSVIARDIEFTIEPIANVDYNNTVTKYEPAIVVKDDLGNTLTKDVDYEVAYSNNTAATEKAEVTVTGKGNYAGSNGKANFTIASYGISLNHSGTVNITVPPGYTPSQVGVDVTNIGNQNTGLLNITISDTTNFVLSHNTISDIIAGETDTNAFTVTPISGLSVGTHTTTVTVTGQKGITATFDIAFAVTLADVYAINVTGEGTFTPATYGYSSAGAEIFTVSNAGNQATGVLTIALSDATHFDLSPTSITDIAVGNTSQFTVTPKTGLSASDTAYTAIVTVSGGHSITESVNLSFTVNRKLIDQSFYIGDASGNIPPNPTYTGSAIYPYPSITVKDGSTTLTVGTDYEVSYNNNINASNAAQIIVTGKGNYTGIETRNFTILPVLINYFSITPAIESGYKVDVDGEFKAFPTFDVKDGSKTLEHGADYTVVYSSSENDGDVNVYQVGATVTITITGNLNYTGTIEKTFTILNNVKEVSQDRFIYVWEDTFVGEVTTDTTEVAISANAIITVVEYDTIVGWYVDGVPQSGTDATFTFSSDIPGIHNVSVVFWKDSKLYDAHHPITVKE